MRRLHTTLGEKSQDELGIILPHEHLFVDLGPIEAKSYEKAHTDEVVKIMAPELLKAKSVRVSALVEATPVGVGRRVDIVKAISQAANLPVVVATGIYREPWIPDWAHRAGEEALSDWMLKELSIGIEDTGVKAAWIKLSAGDDGITDAETKLLRAAAKTGQKTNAVIGSHTIKGRVVEKQLDILEAAGYKAERFIWIHTQVEADFALHLAMAEKGAWLEYDAIGSDTFSDRYFIDCILKLIEAGYKEKILLSHDRGWFDPSKPEGGEQKPFDYLSTVFLPALREAGLKEEDIRQLVEHNPFNAYAR